MRSRWYELKEKAIALRKNGFSIVKIERQLGIPRSTLSGWFKNVRISSRHKKRLLKNSEKALIKARKKAILWHKMQKQKRLQEALGKAQKTLKKIDTDNLDNLELALAILYLGEGSKKTNETAIGNSDPLILKFFLAVLNKVYHLEPKNIRCELSLRADQNPEKMKRFWSKELNLPLSCFKQAKIDKRTAGSKTYPYYKGVCNIRCGTVAIQRKLLYLGDLFCRKIVEEHLNS